MEEQIDIVDKYLKLYDEKNYRDTFYNFSYNDMIQHFIDYEIYDYDEQHGNLLNEDIIISSYKKEISLIDDIDIKEKLIPLILFIGEEFYEELYEIGFFNELKEYLLKKLKNITFNIDSTDLDGDSYQFENQNSLIHKIEEFDFNTILEFGFSEPTIGNYQYSKFIYFIADKMFFEEYCNILNDKDTFGFLYLINTLNSKDKKRRIKLLNYISGNNKLILEIKFLRDLIWYEYDKQLIKEIILSLSQNINIWKSFCEYYLNNPSQYEKLFQPLGEVINDLTIEKIDILIYSVKIDKFSQDNNINVLDNCFLEIKDDEKKKQVLEKLFKRWNNFINQSDYNFNSIVLTDIINVVVVYIKDFVHKDIIIKEVEKIINKLNELDNKWFEDIVEQDHYFYKYMSKLFIYGFTFEKYNMIELKNKVENIIENSIELKKENNSINKNTLELFNKYILK